MSSTDPDLLPENAAQPSDIDGVVAPSGTQGDTFPIVGIGASAGGLQAFQAFFAALPAQPGMAFVLVQHLSPDHESTLAELIQTRTQMTVTQVTDHPVVEPDRVYVIPPGRHLEIENGHLQLVEARRDRGRPAAIDHFFRTLADDAGERAVCIVLSGTGSDGSLGLKAIKERAGLTMAQTPDDAEYDGMPRSALDTDLVDVRGTPAELAEALVRIRDSSGLIVVPPTSEDPLPEDDHQALQAIFAHLRERTAHDFSDYKRTTILRRLARRLQMSGQTSLPAYARYLRETPEEVQALLRDFLISVTQFFRDSEAFDVLERDVIPALFEGKRARDQVRVWVAGCATGEEAYSIAMLLCEHRSQLPDPPDIQVFATDIDESALERAREGYYPEVAAADVSEERLRRFFDRDARGVRVKQELRQIVLFARHNLLSDPPFSRLDLVACRNVLIYFNRPVQERVFGTFHYALRPEGWLFLGSAEGPALVSKGFVAADKPARIYTRRDGGGPPRVPALSVTDGRTGASPARSRTSGKPPEGIVERYHQWTLTQYAPPRLLVDEHYDITHVFGSAGAYLIDREGPVSQNVIDKVVRSFRIDLRAALFQAFSSGKVTDTRFHRVEIGGRERVVRMHVGLVGGEARRDGLAEVVFVELDPATVDALGAAALARDGDSDVARDSAALQIEQELRETRHRLQLTIEESETSTEELKASNEELQSINEELQSTTEELETSKEELQSTNEELQTVNQELKNKIEELTRANSDLQNFHASTEIATLFVDASLRVKRYTPHAAELFNVLPADVGRPFTHLTNRLQGLDLAAAAQRVIDTLVPEEHEVERDDGASYVARLHPYRTVDDRIEGAVMTFVDVTDLQRARSEASRRARQQHSVAQLGLAALEGASPEALFAQACQDAIDYLGADFAKVLQHHPEQGVLVLVEGRGWNDGIVGQATVPDGRASQAGYTLVASEPVVVPDQAAETRFTAPDLLTSHDVGSGVSVPIEGQEGAWGVLGVHSRARRTFSEDDALYVLSIANVLSDALLRARNEATIRTQMAEIQAVYDTAPVGLALYDRELRYRRINERLAEINGVPADEHIGKGVREILPSLADQLEPILDRVLDTGEPVYDLEISGAVPSHPGQDRIWLCSYVPDHGADGGVEGISAVVRDITERKRVERERASALAELAFVLEGAQVGIWTRDLATGRVTLDDRAQSIFGAPAETTSAEIRSRIHPDDQPMAESAVQDARHDPAIPLRFSGRVRSLEEGRAWRWIKSSGRSVPSRGSEGMLTGIVLDVSDLREAEEQLRALTVELEARVAERTQQVRALGSELARAEEAERQRVAVLIHDDLQQLLFGIQVKLSLLSRTSIQDPTVATLVQETDALLERAITATRTLAIDLSPPVLRDDGFLAALEWMVHRVHEAYNLTVDLDAVEVDLDADLQALLVRGVREMLFNVAKHAGVRQAEVRVRPRGDRVEVEISDDGAGFDGTDDQLHGFGLASVRRRLTLVGGDLSIDSAPGTGTRVVLSCPIRFMGPAVP